MEFISELARIRNASSRWVLGLVSGIVFLCGVLWQHPGLVGGGAAVLFLVVRAIGDDAEKRKLARAAAGTAADYESASGAYQVPNQAKTPATARSQRTQGQSEVRPQPDSTDALVDEFLALGRYALLLRPETSVHLAPAHVTKAIRYLDESMALVPSGNVFVGQLAEQAANKGTISDFTPQALKNGLVAVDAVYLDRYAVSNAQYQMFINAGGYEQLEFWAEEALPALLDFIDQTGQPGPRFWVDGHYLPGEDYLPVVGISWYEAGAYANWVGKRLPYDAEWTKASAWPVESAPGRIAQRRYPWGDSFDVRRANLWGAAQKEPVPVHEFATGDSVGGIRQLIGNVWEWTASPLLESAQPSLHVASTMKSIRGGAFDTYFESQATCHYQSGEFPLSRRANIGFRLALSMSSLEPSATDTAVAITESQTPMPAAEEETASAC